MPFDIILAGGYCAAGKSILSKISILAVIVFLAIVPAKLSADDLHKNTVFSDNGSAFFQNNEYLLIGVLVEDLAKTLEIWSMPDSQGFPRLSSITKIRRNETISIFLAYASRMDEINMTYNYRLLKPDGTFSLNEYKRLEIARKISSDDLIYSANQLITVIFDETDSYGKYQFHIAIFDNDILITNIVFEFSLIE